MRSALPWRKNCGGEKYQVLVTTHLDKAHHLHNHFVVNTVSFVDGIKYYRSEKDYFAMQRESDRLCREYGLSVIENPSAANPSTTGNGGPSRKAAPPTFPSSKPMWTLPSASQ